ncbi:MAG: rod shape-determining protein MreC, partial [Sphingomonadales bacterium]|nr:rod shape-determining protein MreC [Sphingomonadales bacterium]
LEARALRQENERLRRLLKLNEEVPDSIAMARLISSTASSSRRIATLGVGSNSGLESGQPVRSPEGLVGRILETGPTTARVLLVSDGKNVTPVQRASDSLPAFATGRGDGTVDIQPINIGSNPFKAGDLMITSGSGGLYSPGIPVAIVIRKTETGAIGRVLANPAKVSHAIVQPIFQAETIRQIEKDVATDVEEEAGE